MSESPYDIKSSLEILEKLYEIEQEEKGTDNYGKPRGLFYEKLTLLKELEYVYRQEEECVDAVLFNDYENLLLYVEEIFENYLVRKNSKYSLKNSYFNKSSWIIIKCPILKLKGQLSFDEINKKMEEIIEPLKSKINNMFDIEYSIHSIDDTKKNVQFCLELYFKYI